MKSQLDLELRAIQEDGDMKALCVWSVKLTCLGQSMEGNDSFTLN